MTSDFECLLCHAVHTEPSTGDSSGAWRCNRCGQHWDAARLATVIEYQRWAKAEAATLAHAASA